MKDSYFLDNNIIIYAHTDIEIGKQKTAQAIIREKPTVISTQVLQEVAITLSKKFKHTWPNISKVLDEASINNIVRSNTKHTVIKACQIADKYKFTFYDSLIIASALECGCNILYSEDMHHGQLIEKKLKIVNPFV
jgi:predicted nucleic acid-binding protein